MAVIYFSASVFLICAILNISVFKREKYTYMAASQRTDEKSERCDIVDRSLIPFTGNFAQPTALARHIIGYTDSSGTGLSGIEKALDSEIKYYGNEKGRFLKDACGNAISAFKATDGGDKKFVKLTLDYHIQQIVENLLDNYGITGAVVILDVDSFDVLAMASRPNYNSDDVNSYIASSGTELLNRAVSQYNAGSIFKIVTMAASLENGICPKTFFCGGSLLFDNLVFPCHLLQGHGNIDPSSAFALSCNCSFYQLGVSLGSEEICRYAQKFGLGEKALGEDICESSGNIPSFFANTRSEAANISIGQGEIMITPLQAAKLACIIASGGVSKKINIIDGIATEKAAIVKNMRKSSAKRIISEATANTIGEMMRQSVENGTGTNAQSEIVAIAGKTGSAETGWQIDESYMVQGWFVGYFPYKRPKYAMAVIAENGRGGNASCAPIFKETAEEIILLGR